MADRKDIHVDLLAIDMETGQYWLDPSQKQSAAREKIRKRNRDKWLAEQKAEADKVKAQKVKSYEVRATPEGEHENETELTEIELWPEEGEKRSEFMDRCVVELEKCIGDRAEEVCDEKWHQSRKLGKKGFVTVRLTGDLAIESCGATCVCDGVKGFDPSEPRDEQGRWTEGGGGGGGGSEASSPPASDDETLRLIGINPYPKEDRFVQWKNENKQRLEELEKEGKAGEKEYEQRAGMLGALEFYERIPQKDIDAGAVTLIEVHGGPRDSDEPSKLQAAVATRFDEEKRVATVEFRNGVDRKALIKALDITVTKYSEDHRAERIELNVFADDADMISAAEEAGFRKTLDDAKVAEFGLQRMVWGTAGQTEGEKAEKDRKSEAWSNRVLGAAKATAILQDYNPDLISVSAEPYHFKVGDKDMTAAGIHEGYKDGAITLYPQTMYSEKGVVSVATHEIAHGKYQKVLNAFEADRQLVFNDPATKPGGPGEMKPDGSLTPPYDKKYPIYSRLVKHDETRAKRAKDDGVSDYSKTYWEDFQKPNSPTQLRTCDHETIAEMARIYGETKKLPGTRVWQSYYKDIMKTYDELRAAGVIK